MHATARKNEPDAKAETRKIADLDHRSARRRFCHVRTAAQPICSALPYVVARDKTDPDALWITEAWDSQASHKASLALPPVRAAIARGRPLIAGFGERFETEPVGGQGLAAPR